MYVFGWRSGPNLPINLHEDQMNHSTLAESILFHKGELIDVDGNGWSTRNVRCAYNLTVAELHTLQTDFLCPPQPWQYGSQDNRSVAFS